jgi:hypothetical protein
MITITTPGGLIEPGGGGQPFRYTGNISGGLMLADPLRTARSPISMPGALIQDLPLR